MNTPIAGTLLRNLRHAFINRLCEWELATIFFLWGYVLLSVPDVYAGDNWAAFRAVITQQHLGWLMMIGGGFRLIILSFNGIWRPLYYARAWMAWSCAIVWALISLGFLSSGHAGPWLAVYPTLLVFESVNLFRAAADAANNEKALRSHSPRAERMNAPG
jgi:hypothetical protein